MSAKTKLKHSLLQILKRDHFGAYATRHDRKNILITFVTDVNRLGYKILDVESLKQKHVYAVVESWKTKGLSAGTIKKRMAAIRYLANLIQKPGIVPSNEGLNIAPRSYVSTVNKSIPDPNFTAISNPYVRMSLELQRVFGLRREESIKIKPHLADRGDTLELASTWCKGGRPRKVPILTEEQRYWLNEAKKLAGKLGNSLIPPEKTYIQQRYVYDKQLTLAGLSKMHGLRHAYAQQRYKELTGFEAPIAGGPSAALLTPEQREQDQRARLVLTEELGHSREQITVNYVGR